MKLIEQIDIQPQTVKWLHDLNEKGMLEVDNSFQRNYVWILKNQVQLIESILNGYPIPEIYLWNTGTDENTGDTKYSIIDGQQRCGAIFQFIGNIFKLRQSYLDESNPIKERIQDRFFKDLDVEDKKAIWSYVFSIRIVRYQIPRSTIVSMFLRLNSNNMTLNPQELRNAEFQGEFMNLAAKLSELKFWDDNKLFSLADRRRMRDISAVSTLLVFLKKGIEEDTGNANLNQIYDLYNDEYPDKEEDKRRFISVIKEIDKVIGSNSERQNILKRQVHFYSLFTVIYDITNTADSLSEKQIDNYRKFIDNYENENLLTQFFPEVVSELYKYQSMAKEGTNKKANRFERHTSLKRIMNYGQ
ncbi:DUF262 domain-containing protein [Pontibacter sp. JH31]|uniref:DUF262 domain-containing protein n=1 Tax=Pontibacter aquaedesilientis TaxID=2766980 RepID=A0ABR7XIU9_9BACT|nr:DUF262 domain-containing protein [Pontibacter aquaedesilientis]MBD1398168.1 DUF262 domain-containing protein [Pontibacter aquaedesilientis]